MSIVPLATARQALSWDVSRDTELAKFLQQVESLWCSSTARKWEAAEDVEEDFEPDINRFRVSLFPVTELVLLGWNIADDEPEDFSDPLVAGTDYRLNKSTGAIQVLGCRHDFYRAKYSGGYATTSTEPEWIDAQSAIITQLKFMDQSFHRDRVAFSFQNIQGGGSMSQTLKAAHPYFQEMAFKYRRR